jgi:hypothetical protein
MSGYTVLFDGLESEITVGGPDEPGAAERVRMGVGYEHFSTYLEAQAALLAYAMPIRDGYASLVRRTRYRTERQLVTGEAPKEYIKGVGKGGHNTRRNKRAAK